MTVTIGYLYKQIINGVLDHLGPEDRYNRMAYAENLRLQRGIDNHIRLRLRNRDQKAVNVGESRFQMIVTDPITAREKFTVILYPKDAVRGIVEATITAAQMSQLDRALYHYGVLMTDVEQRVWPVYVDDNFGSTGVIQVVGDAYPVPMDAIQLDLNFEAGFNVSSTINLIGTENTGLHTAAFYFADFTGTVTVQAHLSPSANVNNSDFFDVQLLEFESQSGIYSHSWSGMFSGIRFQVNSTAGTLNKILYRY